VLLAPVEHALIGQLLITDGEERLVARRDARLGAQHRIGTGAVVGVDSPFTPHSLLDVVQRVHARVETHVPHALRPVGTAPLPVLLRYGRIAQDRPDGALGKRFVAARVQVTGSLIQQVEVTVKKVERLGRREAGAERRGEPFLDVVVERPLLRVGGLRALRQVLAEHAQKDAICLGATGNLDCARAADTQARNGHGASERWSSLAALGAGAGGEKRLCTGRLCARGEHCGGTFEELY
jgi:hypothetical protein